MESAVAAAVDEIVQNAGPGFTKIVFADARYLDVLENWLKFARELSVSNLVVVALDEETHDACSRASVLCARMPKPGSLEELWIRRAQLFSGLCEAGIDFVHSDADAIWLRSPIDRIDALGVDLAFSQGTVWPHDAVDEWGFVLCCGFFAARARPSVAKFFDVVAAQVEVDFDDQAAVNHVLMSSGIVWQPAGVGEERLLKSGRSFRIFEAPVVGRCNALTVALLPHREFPRLMEVSDETYVAHPVSRKSGAEKQRALRHLGLWKIS